MSFGFGISDIVNAINGLMNIVNALRSGREQYKKLLETAESLQIVLGTLHDTVRGPGPDGLNGKVAKRKGELQQLVNNCGGTITDIRSLLDKNKGLGYKAIYRMGSTNLEPIHTRLTMHISAIGVFVGSLTHETIQQIANRPTGSTMVDINNSSHQHQHFLQINHINPQIQIPSCTPCSNNSGDAHEAICDGCDRTICGVRYQCLDCVDFDYCGVCYRSRRQREHYPSHSFQAMHPSDKSLKPLVNDPYRQSAPHLLPASRMVELDDDLVPVGPLMTIPNSTPPTYQPHDSYFFYDY